ncbi:hypothetical protein BDR03DRAFT_958622 [Suillus americanus]|nr:hypothetical protein BDR03DRAFT_958622 [Suillus americanus]
MTGGQGRNALPPYQTVLQALYPKIWHACPATTNGNEQAQHNVNRDGVNLTLLGGFMKGQAFDNRAAQSIDIHCLWALALVIVIPHTLTVHREVSLVKRRHVTQNPVAQPAGNGHYVLQRPAPRRIMRFTPVPSCTLANALRPDIKGVPEPCLSPLDTVRRTHDHSVCSGFEGAE